MSQSPVQNSDRAIRPVLLFSNTNEWLAANQQAPYILFASFIAFNIIASLTGALSPSILLKNTRRQLSSQPAPSPSTLKISLQTQYLKYGATQFVYAAFCIAAALKTLSARQSIFSTIPLECSHPSDKIFCFDKIQYVYLDIHAGWLFFEWVFLNSTSVARVVTVPPLTSLRTIVLIAAYALTKVHPCTLSIIVLPWYQLSVGGAQGMAAVLDINTGLGKPRLVLMRQMKDALLASFIRAVSVVLYAFYSWWWLSLNGMMKLEHGGGRGRREVLNTAYCTVTLGGGFLLGMIYIMWFRKSLELYNRVVLGSGSRPRPADSQQK